MSEAKPWLDTWEWADDGSGLVKLATGGAAARLAVKVEAA